MKSTNFFKKIWKVFSVVIFSTVMATVFINAAENILTSAVNDSKTLFHTLVVSSFDGNSISSRVMVLREFNLNDRIMRFHTDYRAPKISHFSEISNAKILAMFFI